MKDVFFLVVIFLCLLTIGTYAKDMRYLESDYSMLLKNSKDMHIELTVCNEMLKVYEEVDLYAYPH